jgi:hypothetical protein
MCKSNNNIHNYHSLNHTSPVPLKITIQPQTYTQCMLSQSTHHTTPLQTSKISIDISIPCWIRKIIILVINKFLLFL